MSNFKSKVLEIVKQIPAGKTLTYAQVAALAGNPKVARVVGMIISQNYDPHVPCHRVVGAEKLGNYNRGGITQKKELLDKELKINV